MSSDSIYESFKREVIDRRPELFKCKVLNEIKDLFPSYMNPFVGGFGNRESDIVSYKSINIDEEKIFIINKKSEIT